MILCSKIVKCKSSSVFNLLLHKPGAHMPFHYVVYVFGDGFIIYQTDGSIKTLFSTSAPGNWNILRDAAIIFKLLYCSHAMQTELSQSGIFCWEHSFQNQKCIFNFVILPLHELILV